MARYGRRQRRRGVRQKSRVNFTLIVGIILVAVLAGYLTTRFVVYPFLLQKDLPFAQNQDQDNGQQEQNQQDGQTAQKPTPGGVVSDGLDVKDAGTAAQNTEDVAAVSGYCIQFGSFTTQAAADNLISQLSLSGIGAKVVEKDGAYKVVGELFSEKEQAVSAMQAIDQALFEGIFITAM